MRRIFAVISTCAVLLGCVTNPDGSQSISSEGQIALETSVRIAVRHAVADSPRSLEKAQNIRNVVARLQAIATAESTLAALEAEVNVEIDRLDLAPLDKADAKDLVRLFAVALESRLGPDALESEGLVKVSSFLDLVLAAIPAV